MATTVAERLGQHDVTRYTDAFFDEDWDSLEHLRSMMQEERRRRWPGLDWRQDHDCQVRTRAFSCKSAACACTDDAIPTYRVLVCYQVDRALHEVHAGTCARRCVRRVSCRPHV